MTKQNHVAYQVDALNDICVFIQCEGTVQDVVRDLQGHQISDQASGSCSLLPERVSLLKTFKNNKQHVSP